MRLQRHNWANWEELERRRRRYDATPRKVGESGPKPTLIEQLLNDASKARRTPSRPTQVRPQPQRLFDKDEFRPSTPNAKGVPVRLSSADTAPAQLQPGKMLDMEDLEEMLKRSNRRWGPVNLWEDGFDDSSKRTT